MLVRISPLLMSKSRAISKTMPLLIVNDEWLFEDLLGRNGEDKQEESFRFLQKLIRKGDRIVYLENSPFEEKMRAFMECSKKDNDYLLKGIGNFFIGVILVNPSAIEKIPAAGVQPFPDHLKKAVSHKDHYLFQTYFKIQTKNAIILTTDHRWKPTGKTIKIEFRDPFLKKYLK